MGCSTKSINKSIQTDYRESECQTDPYSPPYFLPYEGAYPKLLALVKLTWGKGLPFSLEDIIVIERALSKRMLESQNNGLDEAQGFEQRIQLMEELEAQQWADREKELDKLRQRKMELTSRLLKEYAARVNNDHTLRLEGIHDNLKTQAKEKFKAIKHQYFRDLRKLEKKYLTKKNSRSRDIIKEYTELDSRIYAPLLRDGKGIDELGNEPTEFSWDINDIEKIEKITNDPSFIKSELTFDVDRFKEKIERCKPTGTIKRLERKLEDIYLSFKDYGKRARDAGYGHFDGQNDLNRRPSTPEVTIDVDLEVEARKPHVVLLQKIARGRTIQKLIREEMDKNMQEILGLKRMHDMDPNCQRLDSGIMAKLLAMKKKGEADEIRNTPMEEVIGHLEGETLAKMIDFLDKEMVRLIDERKIHALILLAERERKLKEAQEGGRRHKEEEIRRINDEIFKQVTGIHQSTVEMYLEEVFLECCDRVADDQSRSHVQKLATTLNDALHSNEQTSMSDKEQEELAAELVCTFLIPELQRLYHNNRIEAAGNRYKAAAEQVVDAVFKAEPAVQGLMEEAQPIADEHIQRSKAAFEGGVALVDSVIDEAASKVTRTKSGQEDSLSSKSTESSARDPPSLTGEGKDEYMAEAEVSRISDSTRSESTGKNEESGSSGKKKLSIHVSDDIVNRLAAKSVQVTYDTEVGQKLETVFSNAHEAVDDFFSDVKQKVDGTKSEDSASDATLSEDEDD